MMILQVFSWLILAAGCLLDLALASVAVLAFYRRSPISTVPFVSLVLYGLFGATRAAVHLDPHWDVVAVIGLLHILWHLGGVTLLTRRARRQPL